MGQRVELRAVLRQQLLRVGEALFGDAANLVVDQLCRGLRVRALLEHGAIAVSGVVQRADLRAHAPPGDHLVRDARHLLEVVLGAGGDDSVDQMLSGSAPERAYHAGPHVVLAVVEAVVDRALQRHAQGLSAGDDRHLLHRVSTWHKQTEQRVA